MALLALCLAASALLFSAAEAAETGEAGGWRQGRAAGAAGERGALRPGFLPVCRLVVLVCGLAFAVLFVDLAIRLLPGAAVVTALAAGFAAAALHALLFGMAGPALGLNHAPFVRRWLVPPLALLTAPLGLLAGRRRQEDADSAGGHDLELRLLPSLEGADRLVVEETVEMIDSVREFAEATAREIMTPRTEVEGIALGTPREEMLARLLKAEYSRQVVYDGTLDTIVGVLLAKEVLLNRPEDPLSMMREPLRVPESMHLPELLRLIRRSPSNFAVVTDSYGGTAGIVTMHDLFERVIGEHIEDESEAEELWIDMADDDHATVSGMVELWEVNQELELDLDESVARTIGGYLMYRFGSLPDPGEVWCVNGGEFRVVTVENNRIEVIAFRRDPEAREVLAARVPEEAD